MEKSYIAEAFTNMISVKLVIEAQRILRKNGFEDVNILFSVNIRENRHFQVNVMCEEFVFVVPELDLYEDIVSGNIDERTEKFVRSYGAFMACEYAKHRGKDIGVDPKYAE